MSYFLGVAYRKPCRVSDPWSGCDMVPARYWLERSGNCKRCKSGRSVTALRVIEIQDLPGSPTASSTVRLTSGPLAVGAVYTTPLPNADTSDLGMDFSLDPLHTGTPMPAS